MKIFYLCQKHYDALMKEVKQSDPLPLGATEHMGAIGYLYGEQVQFYIKKYLKKIRVVDADTFKFHMPVPEFDISPERSLVSELNKKGIYTS